jgi:hypothetical protein
MIGRMRLLLVAPLLAGCVAQVPLRGSSYEHLKDIESRVVLPAPEPQVVEALSSLLAERGFSRTDKREVHGSLTYYVFKGRRRTMNSVRGGGGLVVFEGHELGSWFLARVSGGRPTTEVLLIGKPTVDGQEICADSDQLLAEASYWCVDTKARTDNPAAARMHGQEEAETVRGVMSTLRERFGVR